MTDEEMMNGTGAHPTTLQGIIPMLTQHFIDGIQSKPLRMTSPRARAFLKQAQPNRYALYSAGWANGYTVNGISPHG